MPTLLDRINSPADLKKLSTEELRKLAGEIRETIVQVTSCSGGHLASSLGVVELTIALHRIFDTPRDKLIWDVGHQSYPHKLLTGRRDQFPSIRQAGGLSGFTRRAESEYDPFGAGHGSTSISAALGFATARDLRGTREQVVAIIGDGALTGGLALAALNQAGHAGRNLIVVLNDNEMSIGRNVGAISAYLTSMRSAVEPHVRRARAETARLLSRWAMGDAMLEAMDRLKDGIKHLVVPGMLFEELGFTYLGPIDGHNLTQTMEVLESAKRLPGPIMVHVLTQKGRGYTPAEQDPKRFHGTAPFEISDGSCEPKNGASYSQVFGERLTELAEKDKRIVAISAAMIDGTGLEGFKRRFPDRCFDAGMAEEHAVCFAAGLAAAGLRPVVAIYSTFMQRAYDQIIHDVALQELPVVLALDRAGLVGDDGPTHHGAYDLSFLRHIPGLTIMAPSSGAELRRMLTTALSLPGPVALRYPRGLAGIADLDQSDEPLHLGQGRVLREGGDCALLALGTMVAPALAAAELLAARGVDCAVADMRFVKPLDRDLVRRLAAETGCLVTLEENALAGGLGSAVAELLADERLTGVTLTRGGLPDAFVPHGERAGLLADLELDAAGIVAAVERARQPEPGVVEEQS
ncbi:MAG TPA: 1-deoxy-D-xylulose-5-phosphate synthase [Armatimonadota bacterium]|jgi:1-deoxy-D-xylulose-5-phosphate synthase